MPFRLFGAIFNLTKDSRPILVGAIAVTKHCPTYRARLAPGFEYFRLSTKTQPMDILVIIQYGSN